MSKIILFWTVYNDTFKNVDQWRNFTFTPTDLHFLAFQGHEKLQNDVELYSYQQCKLDFTHIKLKDANDYIDYKEAFTALQNGHSIAHISDAIRMKRASEVEGIILDSDAVPLKKFPEQNSWFSTMPCKKTGGFAPKWGENKPPMKVHDNSWDGKELTAFPVKVGVNTKDKFNALAEQIISKLKQPPKQSSDEWNSILWTVKEIANNDTSATIYKPIYMCPLPAWLTAGKCYSLESPTRLDGKTELFGHIMPSIDEILSNSFVVQHFFESAFQKADEKDIFWDSLPKSCLLKKEYIYINGEQTMENVDINKSTTNKTNPLELKLFYIDKNEIKPFKNNPRLHSEEQIGQIANSIKEFGFRIPIAIDENNVILAGHGRYRAAEKLGYEKMPCVRHENLTPVQKKAFVIADNKITLNSNWDLDLLWEQVQELNTENFDLDILGFEEAELLPMIDSNTVIDIEGEWDNMPEYTSEDISAHRTIKVHFKNDQDVSDFMKLVGQKLTEKTKFIWYPEEKQFKAEEQRYD